MTVYQAMPPDAVRDARLGARAAAPRWWVAFSGGLDSSVLLHWLVQWCERQVTAPPVTALHVHHNLHPEADAWAERAATTARQLGVAFLCERVTVAAGPGVEAAAREARYRAFAAHLGPGEVLWMAHHADDQAETVLLRLLQGRAPAGLRAMPGERPLGAGRVVRPLLDVSRAALTAYARTQALSWSEDPSNRDTALDRNFLRHRILPLIQERWPEALSRLGQVATHTRAHFEQVDEHAAACLAMLSPGRDRYGDYLPLSEWAGLPAYLRLAVLRAWLTATGDPMPGRRALVALAEQCRVAARDSRPGLSMPGVAWWRFRDRLYRVPRVPSIPAGYSRTWHPSAPCRLPDGSMLTAEATADGDAVPVGGPLFVEYREGGERFCPVGRRHSQTLKRLLQEAGVPPWVRSRLPLVYRGERLVAVADRWVSAKAATMPGEPGWRVHWHPPDA